MPRRSQHEEAELADLAQEIERELRIIREMLRKPVEAEFARGELTGPQRSIMQILVRSPGGLSLKELSNQAGLAHSTVSGIVDRLEKRGMAQREQDHIDGRFSKIRTSAQVETYLRDTLPRVTLHPVIQALRRAQPAERRAILRGLRILHRLVDPT